MPKKALAAAPKKTWSALKLASASLVVSGLLLGLVALGRQDQLTVLEVGQARFKVIVADDALERATGLGGKLNLPPDQGMWFVFNNPDYHGIWMKDMNLAVDVVWVDASLKVVDIKPHLSPDTYPRVFKPQQPAKYVLEVAAGSVDRLGIGIGDIVKP